MTWLIWTGAAVSAVGLAGLVWCIAKVWRAKRRGLSDDALRAVVKSVVAPNMAALMLSTIGLMGVIVGIFLG